MYKKFLVALVFCSILPVVIAQEGMRVVRPPDAQKMKAKPASTPAELKSYGNDLLQITETESRALEGGMRAWALCRVARGYQQSDKKKAVGLLEDALASAMLVPEDRLHTRAQLQQEIVNTLVPLAPQRADELVSNIDPDARPNVLTALLRFYRENGKTDRALQAIYRIGEEREIPYDTATELMATMTSKESADFQRLFSTSLSSYRAHGGERRLMEMGNGFPEMISHFWRQLPPALVRESIDEVLKQTDPANAKSTPPALFSMASNNGSVTFPSAFQYQLFQFIPILQQIDSSAAEQYLKKYNELSGKLNKYPNGAQSLWAQPEGDSAAKLTLGAGVTYSVSRNEPENNPYMADMHKVQKLTAEAESGHASDALPKILTIGTPNLRGAAYNNIAHATMDDHPEIARECLSKLLDISDKLPLQFKLMGMRAAINVYMHMNDLDNAKSMIEKAMSVTHEVYREDANPDDPNKALKAYWPATDAYRGLLHQASRISPAWAMTLLNDIRDPEVKVAAEVAVSGTWLGIPMGMSVTMTDRKGNFGTMVSGEEAD